MMLYLKNLIHRKAKVDEVGLVIIAKMSEETIVYSCPENENINKPKPKKKLKCKLSCKSGGASE